MISSEISNNRLLRLLRGKIAKNAGDIKTMKSTLYCGSQVTRQGVGTVPAVYVLANNVDAKFYGTTTCKNAWFCPSCSAKVMAKYAAEIACAIEAIHQYKNQVACMITFTIPHTSGMKCEETADILFDTWKAFNVRGNHNLKTKWNQKDPFASFCEEFNCKHRIKVGEFTWGDNGWHPHFHCLFFVDKAKLQKVIKWQELLNNRWYALARRQTIKKWNKLFPDQKDKNKIRADIMYDKMDKAGSKGCYISVDKDGKVIEQKSSRYICGWGADRELTGNYQNKATNEGHMSPQQILQKAEDTSGDEREKWLDLYMEYARATRNSKRRRISFGQSGIKAMVAKWKLTNAYKEVVAKKNSDLVRNGVGFWKVVCWFTESQWLQICWLDRTIPIKQAILEAALNEDAREIIKNTLEQYDIYLTDDNNELGRFVWKQAQFIENMLTA